MKNVALVLLLMLTACDASRLGTGAKKDTDAESGEGPASICGAEGQEAYFETRQQDIYICRNENDALTYIATPKKEGNSVFLPATAVPDGEATAYLAQDETSVFVVGPFGYRQEEKGKAIAQEKVLRHR